MQYQLTSPCEADKPSKQNLQALKRRRFSLREFETTSSSPAIKTELESVKDAIFEIRDTRMHQETDAINHNWQKAQYQTGKQV